MSRGIGWETANRLRALFSDVLLRGEKGGEVERMNGGKMRMVTGRFLSERNVAEMSYVWRYIPLEAQI